MQTMSEAQDRVHIAGNKIIGAYNEAYEAIRLLVPVHAAAWELVGVPRNEAIARANKLFDIEEAIRTRIGEIQKAFRAIERATKAVSAAVDEAEAKRKHEARSYQV